MKIGRLWLVIAAACLVPAVLDGGLTYVQGVLAGREPGWQEIFWQANEWLILAALTPLVYWLARRYPLRPPIIGRNLLAHVGGALLLCIGWATAGASLRWVLGIGPTEITKTQHLTGWLLTTIPWGTFMYFTTLGCMHAFGYFVEAKEREAQTARLAAQVAEARLGALRTQLHPHFLFNSLNAITVLVRDQDTVGAARMLDLLSDVLRQVLRSDKAHEVSLDTELRFLERYLAIEQVRFSDRLRVHFDVDDGLLDALVPEFLLQPIVENALRHGIAKRAEGGSVEISAHRAGDSLVLSVSDDGPGLDAPPSLRRDEPGNGLGLANVRERLTTLYGAQGRLDLIARPAAERGGTFGHSHAAVSRRSSQSAVPNPQSPGTIVIRALIVDDEPLARRGIRQLLEPCDDVDIVGECRNGREALTALETLAPDLVFLDVQMPELDGFEVVRARGAARMPHVIFVTAYDEFAVRAFEAHALDYLVKPVNEERFTAALDRARERMRFAEALELTRRIGDLLASHDRRGNRRSEVGEGAAVAPTRRLVVPTATGDLVLDVDEIDWIQADDYYAAVHARGGGT